MSKQYKHCKGNKYPHKNYKKKQKEKKENILLILADMIKDLSVYVCNTFKNVVKLVTAVSE